MIGILPFFSIMIAYVEDVEFILKNIFQSLRIPRSSLYNMCCISR